MTRPTPTLFVELCAGSGALSLALMQKGASAGIPFMGNKSLYADSALSVMGLRPGQGASAFLWVDPGPWAWLHASLKSNRPNLLDRLRTLGKQDPRTLYHRVKTAPVPSDPTARAVMFAVLQWWAFRRIAVGVRDGRWLAPGFNEDAYGRQLKGSSKVAPLTLERLAARLEAIPSLERVTILHTRAELVVPQRGDSVVTYLDPPYAHTEAYGSVLARPDVQRLAGAWRSSGAAVFISEHDPVPVAAPSRSHLLSRRGGTFKSNVVRRDTEYLTECL